MLGPAFAGVAVAFGPLAPLYGVAGLAVLAWLVVFFFLPENTPPRERQQPPKLKFTDPRLKSVLIFGLVGGAISAIPVQMLGFYFIDMLALSSEDAFGKVSIALTASAIASLFAQIVLVGRLSFSPRILMRFGVIILVVSHGLFAIALNFPVLVFASLFNGLGWGMVYPGFTAAASLAVTTREQGATAGLANAASSTGFILAPPIGFGLYTIDPRWPFVLTTLAAIALAAFAWRGLTTTEECR